MAMSCRDDERGGADGCGLREPLLLGRQLRAGPRPGTETARYFVDPRAALHHCTHGVGVAAVGRGDERRDAGARGRVRLGAGGERLPHLPCIACAATSAPCSSSAATILASPFCAAAMSAVRPSRLAMFESAPFASRVCTISRWPPAAAAMRAVSPKLLVALMGSSRSR